MGQRYVELAQGVGPVDGTLRPGATIPLERTTPALNLTQLFNGFQPLFQALSPKDVNQLSGEIIQVLQGEGTTVESLIRHGRLADQHPGRQGPGDRPGDRQPDHGA